MPLQHFRSMLARRHNVRAHFWQSCSSYTQQISGLVLSVLLARLLVPEDFGRFAYVSAVLSLFLLPASWSLSPQIVAEMRTHPEIVNDALHYSRILFIPRSFLAAIACAFLFATKGGDEALMGLVLSIPLVGHEFLGVIRSAMEGQGEFRLNFFDSLATATASAFISVPAAWLGAGVWALVLPSLPLFAIQIVLFTRLSGIRLKPTSPRSGRNYFQSATKLWLAGASDTALLRADKFLLGKFAGMAPLGDYNRAFNFSPVAARALNSFLAAPTISALTRSSRNEDKRTLIHKSSLLLAVAGVTNFIVWWFFSDPLVPWIFGPQWTNAIPVFEAMAPLSLAMSCAYLPTTMAFAQRAYGRLAIIRATSLLAFLGAALWMGGQLSAVSMAWLLQATLGAQGLLLFLVLWPEYFGKPLCKNEAHKASLPKNCQSGTDPADR